METKAYPRLGEQVIWQRLPNGLPIAIIIAVLSRMIPLWMGAEVDILDTATTYNLITAVGRPFMMASMVLNSAFRGYGDTKTPMKLNLLMNQHTSSQYPMDF